jgi:hypothetical protein
MDLMLLRMFQHNLLSQLEYIEFAHNDIHAAHARISNSAHATSRSQTSPTSRVWFGVQQMVIASANAAKLLWGSGGKLTQQREPLRLSVGVDDTSPFKDVAMRNHFEHIDERLDRWWKEDPDHNIADGNIVSGGARAVYAPSFHQRSWFREFNITTGALSFWATSSTSGPSALPRFESGPLSRERRPNLTGSRDPRWSGCPSYNHGPLCVATPDRNVPNGSSPTDTVIPRAAGHFRVAVPLLAIHRKCRHALSHPTCKMGTTK